MSSVVFRQNKRNVLKCHLLIFELSKQKVNLCVESRGCGVRDEGWGAVFFCFFSG